MPLNSEKKCGEVNSRSFSVFEKKIVCLSVCLAFYESADARDLGLMTLFSGAPDLERCGGVLCLADLQIIQTFREVNSFLIKSLT